MLDMERNRLVAEFIDKICFPVPLVAWGIEPIECTLDRWKRHCLECGAVSSK